MIYTLYIIDIKNPGFPLVEHNFSKNYIEDDKNFDDIVFDDIFIQIEKTLLKIQKEILFQKQVNEFIRILIIKGLNVILYYCNVGEFVLCTINDLDDDKDKILESLDSLGRRFLQKHRTDVQEFRYSNHTKYFTSFLYDIKNITLNGMVGENYPIIIVNDATLDRLQKLRIITDLEYSVAKSCVGEKTPYGIADFLDIEYEYVKNTLLKLKNLDIIDYKNISLKSTE